MTWPREGSREIDEGIIVSVPCDWCKSPNAIVPYKIWARQEQASNLANSVRQTSNRTHVKGSLVLSCYGDEAGTGGGVRSGTHNAECTPKTGSESLFAEGRNVVRHDDEWWMNHENTCGKFVYLKDMDPTSETDPRQINPLMSQQNASLYEASYNGSKQYAQEVPLPGEGGGLEELDPYILPPEAPTEVPAPSGTPDPVPGPEAPPTAPDEPPAPLAPHDSPPPAPGDTPGQEPSSSGSQPKPPPGSQPRGPKPDKDTDPDPNAKKSPARTLGQAVHEFPVADPNEYVSSWGSTIWQNTRDNLKFSRRDSTPSLLAKTSLI